MKMTFLVVFWYFSTVRGNETMMLVSEFPGSNTALIPSYDGMKG